MNVGSFSSFGSLVYPVINRTLRPLLLLKISERLVGAPEQSPTDQMSTKVIHGLCEAQ